MTDVTKARPVPPPNPHILHPKDTKPRFTAVGGPIGLAVWVFTALTLCVVGMMAWSRYGHIARRVFELNTSASFESRIIFLESRIAEVEKAHVSRRFGFTSPWLPANHALRVYKDGEALVLDASDVKNQESAREASKDLAVFQKPGADLNQLIIRFGKDRTTQEVAQAAALMLEATLDVPPEGGASDVILFNDMPLNK